MAQGNKIADLNSMCNTDTVSIGAFPLWELSQSTRNLLRNSGTEPEELGALFISSAQRTPCSGDLGGSFQSSGTVGAEATQTDKLHRTHQ